MPESPKIVEDTIGTSKTGKGRKSDHVHTIAWGKRNVSRIHMVASILGHSRIQNSRAYFERLILNDTKYFAYV